MANTGLEDIVVNTSSICDVNGDLGALIYRGYDIHDLATHATFEEVIYLLWYGELPTTIQLEQFTRELAQARALPAPIISMIRTFPASATPMDVLRTITSALAIYDVDTGDNSRDANVRKAIRLTAQIPTIVATFDRLRSGLDPVAPRNGLGLAADFLYMLSGNVPDEVSIHAFDVALILHADHELNASTFAARVAAATLTDMYSAITAAIGTLAGPLHGGANQRVMEMLEEIGDEENAETYIRDALAQHRKIMGFGHRVYHTEDPRATHLRQMSHDLGVRTGEMKWYNLSMRVEHVVLAEKHLNANVDFYSASVYHSLSIRTDLFTPIFACSRVAGWTAHVLEQLANNRLIRPRADYTGPRGRLYAPVGER